MSKEKKVQESLIWRERELGETIFCCCATEGHKPWDLSSQQGCKEDLCGVDQGET
jgi:hypothetical protein